MFLVTENLFFFLSFFLFYPLCFLYFFFFDSHRNIQFSFTIEDCWGICCLESTEALSLGTKFDTYCVPVSMLGS